MRLEWQARQVCFGHSWVQFSLRPAAKVTECGFPGLCGIPILCLNEHLMCHSGGSDGIPQI